MAKRYDNSVFHPKGLFYFQDFCSAEEASKFLTCLYKVGRESVPAYRETLKWVQLRHRRLMNIGGNPPRAGTAAFQVGDPTTEKMKSDPIPEWVSDLAVKQMQQTHLPWTPKFRSENGLGSEEESLVFDDSRTPSGIPNHVLINEYKWPEGCIFPHEDGPSYEPLVAIVSLQSTVPLVFTRKPGAAAELPERVAVLLEPNSLVVFSDDFYTEYLHEVPPPRWQHQKETVGESYPEKEEESIPDDILVPDLFLNFELAAKKLQDSPTSTDSGIPLFRGNVRTSVTYRVVPGLRK